MDKVTFDNTCSFFGFQEGEFKHRLAVEGEKLWNILFERNPDFGGWFAEITGLMGRGKTSLMLAMADKIIKEYPDELIFWREAPLSPLQAPKIGDNFQLFSERKNKVKVFELGERRPIPTDDIEVKYFHGGIDLIKQARPGQLNVVYFKNPQRWLDLMFRLRFNTKFQTLLIDEMEDITPGRCRKEDGSYWNNDKFANHLKEIRKCKINITYNTQSKSDIDWRIRSKVMMHVYLPGSRGDNESPIYKGMIQALKVGDALLDLGFSLFGKIRFDVYKPKDKLYAVFPIDKRGRLSTHLS